MSLCYKKKKIAFRKTKKKLTVFYIKFQRKKLYYDKDKDKEFLISIKQGDLDAVQKTMKKRGLSPNAYVGARTEKMNILRMAAMVFRFYF